jgi:hypothetical protein
MDFTSIETIVGRTGAMIFILANVLQSHHSSQLGRRAPCGGRSGVSIFWLTPSTNSLKRVNRSGILRRRVRAAENVKHLEQARREFDN